MHENVFVSRAPPGPASAEEMCFETPDKGRGWAENREKDEREEGEGRKERGRERVVTPSVFQNLLESRKGLTTDTYLLTYLLTYCP